MQRRTFITIAYGPTVHRRKISDRVQILHIRHVAVARDGMKDRHAVNAADLASRPGALQNDLGQPPIFCEDEFLKKR